MALPTLESTWTHVNNTQLVYTTEANMTAQIFWRMTRALVACPGATVRFSNSAAGTSSGIDGIDHLVNFAGVQARTTTLTSANTSYIVVRLSGVGSTFDVCIAHCSNSATRISISMSVGGNFVQAVTPTHHPTATDIMHAATVTGATFGCVTLQNTTANRRFHYSYTAAGDQIRFMVTTETTLVFDTLTEIGLCDGQYTSAWIGPEAFISHGTAAAWAGGSTQVRTKFAFNYSTPGAVPANQYMGCIRGVEVYGNISALNNNEWPVSPIFGIQATTTGFTEWVFACRFKDIFCVPVGTTDGMYFPDPGTKTFIVMSDMLLPWDGSVLL